MRNKGLEFAVGVFILAGLLALLVLAFQVSSVTGLVKAKNYYEIIAEFDNTGDLKKNAPVAVSGVVVGHVKSIQLDPQTFRAKVTMKINSYFNRFPVDTSASILTQGLLGSNYISLTPGFDEKVLQSGGVIESTHSAIILENIIGQLMFNVKNSDK